MGEWVRIDEGLIIPDMQSHANTLEVVHCSHALVGRIDVSLSLHRRRR